MLPVVFAKRRQELRRGNKKRPLFFCRALDSAAALVKGKVSKGVPLLLCFLPIHMVQRSTC